MKQAIEFSHRVQNYLHVGARRKSHTSYMIVVSKGSALIRLGKQEYLVPKGHGFWIPFDCLHALTVLPGTQYDKVEFSARLTSPVCREAGFFKVSSLISALLSELHVTAKSEGSAVQSNEVTNLLRVIADQAAKLRVNTSYLCPSLPRDFEPQLNQLLKGDKVTEKSALTAIANVVGISANEFEACITMREALKLSRSGRKLSQIAETLNTPAEAISALSKPILGEVLA